MSSVKSSLLIASCDPKNLASFYSLVINGHFGSGFSQNHFLVFQGRTCLIQIFKPSSAQSFEKNSRNQFSLCFQDEPSLEPQNKIIEWSKKLLSIGAEVVDTPKEESFGVELWMSDPEANKFLIFVPRI